jgi:S1-C subfamily serine protease/Tfp pilus assembly protein PilF
MLNRRQPLRLGLCGLLLLLGGDPPIAAGGDPLTAAGGDPLTASSIAAPAEATIGEAIHKLVSQAVFLIETLDDDGEVQSLGSAFLVAKQDLLTNYHVVEHGVPQLRVGTVRIPCTVSAVDVLNDLALLRVAATIDADPLLLAGADPPAGSTVFAIGNPAGLERTITQGLVSGIRQVQDRSLLQISASISPGSSGGPVVDVEGTVVGIAAEYLENGQNINFAIPASAILTFLQNRGSAPDELQSLLARVVLLDSQRAELDLNDFDRWRGYSEEIRSLLTSASSIAAGSVEELLSVATAADAVSSYAEATQAARAVLQLAPKELRAHRVLAISLDHQSWFLEEQDQQKLRSEALKHAQAVVEGSLKPKADDLFQLALLMERDSYRKAEATLRYQEALAAARMEQQQDLRPFLRGLFRMSTDIAKARVWFDQIVKHGGAEAFDWQALARRYSEVGEHLLAADSWIGAANVRPTVESLCEAGNSYWIGDNEDAALAALRRCIAVGSTQQDVEIQLASAHSLMSSILFDRGVYDQSIAAAKQAIALHADSPWAYLNLSRSLNTVGRHSEAVAAAESAIRLSDGKFATMHFALGAAYFDSENWARAALAFEKAAELEPKDWAAAYNVALCMQRQYFRLDAARWFEEVLRRKPDHPEREDLLRRIRVLRQ